ncbi:beta-lactamase family protein [Paenibacillus sp. KQZ6P-2]|uniref:Beta-lactamase family protein n=1 Tax=Paenibacillus mangrovi TaxID=2931978 RepID=A0A9X1WP26_9BACL|nr:serine hydrolase domain-containing protein [Paenibacillus mangrovi]MCJ8012126.1 beta-lactamase family protein [Paenibacillus mangrovi]
MKKRLLWVLAAAMALTPLVPAGASAASEVSVSDQASKTYNLEQLAAEKAALLTKDYGTTSVQYALIDKGRITLSGQTGKNDAQGKVPLTRETMYGIGSTSKMFTTAAVMKLVDEGKVNLDTPLVKYIPDFKMKDERYKQITPRMLLNHSSGLQGSSLGNAFLFNDNDSYAHDTLLTHLASQSLKADPGAFSVYCNDGFTLAEILVERVSGVDFTAFIHDNFMKPLGMDHTKTSQEVLEPGKLAGLYYPAYPGQLPNETVNVIGTGGIYSTAEDLVRFSQMFTGQNEGLLSSSSVRAMEQAEYKKGLWPKDTDNSLDFGLGWDSVRLFPFNDYGMTGLVKGGDTILYHASLVVLPEQNLAAAVLSSGGSSSTNQLLASELLLQALKEKGVIKEIKPAKSFGKPVKADMPNEVAEHAGYYGSIGQQIKISIQKGELTLSVPTIPGYPEEKFVYTSDGTFVNEDGSSKLSFVTEKNGHTYLWSRQYTNVPGLGQMALSHYLAEKLEEHPVTPETATAWAKRDGKTFYPVSEKYSSIMYMIKPTLDVTLTKDMPGYLGDKAITGPDTAAGQLQIPAMGGRDSAEYHFFLKDGVEYLEAAGSLYIGEDGVKTLYPGKQSNVTVQPSGDAKWYSVPASAAGKTMKVDMPTRGSFAVYDAAGSCVNYSVLSGSYEAVLPDKGTIVFAGDPGSAFRITLKQSK